MTHLSTGGVLTHRVDVVPPLGDEQEDGAQNDVANVGEEVIKVAKVNQQMVGIGAGEIVVAHILVSRRHHHLLNAHFSFYYYVVFLFKLAVPFSLLISHYF
jgi:hypothetical protein